MNCWKVLTGQGARSALVARCLGTKEPAGLHICAQGKASGEDQWKWWAVGHAGRSAGWSTVVHARTGATTGMANPVPMLPCAMQPAADR